MEVSQGPGQVEDPPGHRWAGVLGTLVAVVTLTLPIVMIASYSPSSSNARPAPTTFDRPYQTQDIKPNPME
jgi:hypothetical protein